jgi:hypothetical protein
LRYRPAAAAAPAPAPAPACRSPAPHLPDGPLEQGGPRVYELSQLLAAPHPLRHHPSQLLVLGGAHQRAAPRRVPGHAAPGARVLPGQHADVGNQVEGEPAGGGEGAGGGGRGEARSRAPKARRRAALLARAAAPTLHPLMPAAGAGARSEAGAAVRY